MPWKTTSPMEKKHQFVVLAETGEFTISELCQRFGISRKSGHKWIKRFRCDGPSGLEDRSRTPKTNPGKTPDKIERIILAERRRYPTWGPKKLRERLRAKHGIESPPAVSTVGEILKRHGMVQARKRRPGVFKVARGKLTGSERNNQVWATDYKGWFHLGDGSRCDPLTITDLHSRYVIRVEANENSTQRLTKEGFRRAFRHHGLPEIIRVDNGSPFASMGPGGLSKLSVWWLGLGIDVEFTRPGCPQDNGSHERMHRTMKAECCRPGSVNLLAQQQRFERWRNTFNHERPHEALKMRMPGEIYSPSNKRLDESIKRRLYGLGDETVKVSGSGSISLDGRTTFVGEAFSGQEVALERDSKSDLVLVRYANVKLGECDPGSDQGRIKPVAYEERWESRE